MAASSSRTNRDTKDICRKFCEEFSLKDFGEQLDKDYDRLREDLNKQKMDSRKHPLMETIDQWESESMENIRKIAEECRAKWIEYSHKLHDQIDEKLNDLARRIKKLRDEKQGKEIVLKNLQERLRKLREELMQPGDIRIERQSTSFIDKISLSKSSKGTKEFSLFKYLLFRYSMATDWKDHCRWDETRP